MKRIWIVAIVLCALQAQFAYALPPPKDLSQINLDAPLIVIGQIHETGKILLGDKQRASGPVKDLVVLRVLYVVKGNAEVAAGEQLRIESPKVQTAEKGLSQMTTGLTPLKVSTGDVVIAYVAPSPHQGFYRPVLGGASIEVLPVVIQTPDVTDKAK